MAIKQRDGSWPFMGVAMIVKGQHRLLGRSLSITGLDNLPLDGPVILAANHVSFADPLILGMAVERSGRAIRYLAKRELFDNPVLRPILTGAKQIPVDRTGNAAASLIAAEQALREGAVVAIFPEATIPRPGEPRREPKSGAARLAIATGAPLVPAATWGGQEVSASEGRSDGSWLRYGVRFGAAFGPALQPEPDESPQQLTKRLMVVIDALADEAKRLATKRSAPPSTW